MEQSADEPVPFLTCMACCVKLVGTTERTEHYRSDWHRVNLKRKVSGMPPMKLAEFEERMDILKLQQKQQQDQEAKNARGYVCEVCSKKFSSEKAVVQHEQSRRHLDKLEELKRSGALENLPVHERKRLESVLEEAQASEQSAEQAIKDRMDTAEPIPPTCCVFDMHPSDNIESNLEYMARNFSFFVPYIEFVNDLNGILAYLGEKVGVGYACICCDRSFGSVAAAQAHMIGKSHCKMPLEEDIWMEEFGAWYNFEFSEDEDDGNAWEEVTGAEADQLKSKMEDDGSRTLVVASARSGASYQTEQDGNDEVPVGLVLANGKVVGHRSLKRYYDQKLKPARSHHDAARVNRVLSEYRALGWHSQGQEMPLEIRQRFLDIQKKTDLTVGMKTYYTRKAKLNPSMGVLNSGYRP